ncbi:hypothetical protein ACTOVN_00450 [Arcanobacterium canis]
MNELRNYPDWLWALRYGWQASPAFATASTIMLLGVALIPAVNVLLIRQLSNSLSNSHGAIGLIGVALTSLAGNGKDSPSRVRISQTHPCGSLTSQQAQLMHPQKN